MRAGWDSALASIAMITKRVAATIFIALVMLLTILAIPLHRAIQFCDRPARLLRLEREHLLPVLLHVDEGPAFRPGLVPCLVELSDLRWPVVGVFARGVRVVHDAGKARARACRGPLQHLQIAVGVAESEDRAAADEAVDAYRLAGPVIDELDFRLLHQHRLAVGADLELHHA